MIKNHKEAYELAASKQDESNLARCYLDLKEEVEHLRSKIFTNGDRNMTMEGRHFTIEGDGFILDNNFDFDAGLSVSGDFVDNQKNEYAQMIADVLNGTVK
jgi:hypothetical protein